MRDLEGKKLTVIKFYHAFLVNLENHFEGAGQQGAQPSQQVRLRISPQAVDNNGNFHDNDWPKPDPIVDWNWTTMNQLCNPKAVKPKAEDEPSLLSQIGDALTNISQQLPALQPKAKGMTGEEDMRPEDPGRMSDEKAPRPFDPGRTPDYPSANKPQLPTIGDTIEQIGSLADQIFSSEPADLGFDSMKELGDDPSLIWGKTEKDLEATLRAEGWQPKPYKGNSKAVEWVKDTPAGRSSIVFNYGGGRHGDKAGTTYDKPIYYKLSGPEFSEGGTYKKTKVVGPDYKQDENEKYRVIDGLTGKIIKE